MKKYLSMGMGVNSVAMYFYMLDKGENFEAVFVDHETDWPETYAYAEMFMKHYPVTVLKPERKMKDGTIHNSLYEYCWDNKMFPNRAVRWCTSDFKRHPLERYQEHNSWVYIGYAYDEAHRAKITSDKHYEYRFPLIEAEITREECYRIILRHGLGVPPKSGCYICPFMRRGELRKLRREHPNLFCKLERLEDRNNDERLRLGKDPYYSFGAPVREVAESKGTDQKNLFTGQVEYPPCECWL